MRISDWSSDVCSSDLVPREDHPKFAEALLKHRTGGIGSTGDDNLAKTPLEYLYEQFTAYVEDRRSSPQDDVLTGLACATFPDGSTPEVIDVVRVADRKSTRLNSSH